MSLDTTDGIAAKDLKDLKGNDLTPYPCEFSGHRSRERSMLCLYALNRSLCGPCAP